jgi:hypothetical protein
VLTKPVTGAFFVVHGTAMFKELTGRQVEGRATSGSASRSSSRTATARVPRPKSGPHPGFFGDFCEIATDLIG